MNAQFIFSIVIYLVALGAAMWAIVMIARDKKSKNKEIGRVLIEYGITYTLSALVVLQIIANLSEAGIVAGLQDPDINTGARMSLHFFISGIGILGALVWIKAIREHFTAWSRISEDGWGAAGLIAVTGIIAFISALAAVLAPIANLLVLANAVHNTRELGVFLHYVGYQLGWLSEGEYLVILTKNGARPDYSAWGSLKNIMASSCTVTAAHVLVAFWEVMIAFKLSLTKKDMNEAFTRDLDEDEEPEDKDKEKDKGGKDKGDKDKNKDDDKDDKTRKKEAHETMIADIVDWLNPNDPSKWEEKLLNLMEKSWDKGDFTAVRYTVEMTKIYKAVKGLKDGKGNAKRIEDELRKLVKDRSAGKLNLPKRKEKN